MPDSAEKPTAAEVTQAHVDAMALRAREALSELLAAHHKLTEAHKKMNAAIALGFSADLVEHEKRAHLLRSVLGRIC